MVDDRIPTHLWIDAHLHRFSIEGIPAVVIKTGQKLGGTILLKIYQSRTECKLLTQMRDLDGQLIWITTHKEDVIEEEKADALVQKYIERDPDLWVIEIESHGSRIPVDGL